MQLTIGLKIFKLTVVAPAPSKDGRHSFWVCLCDCGNQSIVRANNILTGHSKSCGCNRKTRFVRGPNKHTRGLSVSSRITHGHCVRGRLTAEYRCWCGILQRCTNPNTKFYAYYGGRGIKVCQRWLRFENFLADMGLKPHPKLSIERLNNDGDYEPSNCKWASSKEQSLNKRPKGTCKQLNTHGASR